MTITKLDVTQKTTENDDNQENDNQENDYSENVNKNNVNMKHINKNNNHKKNDLLLIGVLLILALIIGLGYSFFQGMETKYPVAVITIDGKEYGRFPLDRDREERIDFSDGSYNILVIKDGVADMTEASCPDKICVDHRSICKKNESITCLPNKVVITIENGEESDLDLMQ